MALDKMMTEPILSTWRNMEADLNSKNISGEYYDKFVQELRRLEQMCEEYDDIMAFSSAAMDEKIYEHLGDFYAKALNSGSSEKGGGYGDEELLAMTVKALKDAIAFNEKSYQDALSQTAASAKKSRELTSDMMSKYGVSENADSDAPAMQSIDDEIPSLEHAFKQTATHPDVFKGCIQPLIDLAEQPDMTYPKFLKLQIEQGLDRALEGTVSLREKYVRLLDDAKFDLFSPRSIAAAEQQLQIFDKLAASSPFGIPRAKELTYALMEAEYEDKLPYKEYDLQESFLDLLDDLAVWSLSFVPFAKDVEPWSAIIGDQKRQEAIVFDQKTGSGLFKAKEKLLLKYCGMDFPELLTGIAMKWAVETQAMRYSQEFVEFLVKQIYPACIPCSKLPQDLIDARASFHPAGPQKQNRELNPDHHKYYERGLERYERLFGKGSYQKAFPNGMPSTPKTDAKPWDWAGFNPKQ